MSIILVVEDNLLSAGLMRDVLTYRGHVVLEAASVASAREHLRSSRLDLVLTDLRLPDGSGAELLSEIRADPAMMRLPVVVVTASAMGGDRERIVALGFDGYVTKPLNLTAFERQIDGWLELGARRAG
jgi:CheY-like chemotaxis protein